MFRLEKVFQNDDKFYNYFSIFFKSLIIYFVIYLFIILENNSIYSIGNLGIYVDSNYYIFSIFLPILFFISNFFILKETKFNNEILRVSFTDLKILLINIFILFFFFSLKNYTLLINKEFLLLFFLLIFFILFSNLILNRIYKYLIESNIIQRNILLVGNYKDVIKILNEKKDLINIYKCCLVTDINDLKIKNIRNEIKIPTFNLDEDVRSILEYHHLGQVWILDNSYDQKILENMISLVIKFSVDILIVKIDKIIKKNSQLLVNNKYHFINYEISKFYGINFLIKILLDKILSLVFITILSPVLLICLILIYLEDGYPLIFFQDRTGWDGRRFRIFKLRTLKNIKFDKTQQVQKNDERLLKIGKFIRKYSIDEVPQFFNVLLGDMSIVGPRPHMVEHDIFYSKIFKEFLKRHKTNPGLTGWAQINGLRGATPNQESMRKRMEYDLWYLNNWNPLLDIIIILKTFFVIFKYKGD
jgi:exopolysaccharide biosynthesis polyprenyl glycosylphosphotransferase